LPSNDLVVKIIEDHFILYKPRDIVSGDFYWFTSFKNKIVIAAADCTGHGVPGAFMSLIGISFLNEIVNGKQIFNANEILNHLRDSIILSLQHSGKDEETKDGMDIALCIIDKEKKELQYAGANNPMLIIRNNKIIEIKPDKMPIGGHRLSANPFKNNIMKYEENDSIYLFTDGYVDQFGGLNDKKFKSHNFRKLLLQIQDFPIKKQKSILDNKFEAWKGNSEQVDDILVIGIKLNSNV
jgi:serine phosphatase RsbU (regulator of sigma subunit)